MHANFTGVCFFFPFSMEKWTSDALHLMNISFSFYLLCLGNLLNQRSWIVELNFNLKVYSLLHCSSIGIIIILLYIKWVYTNFGQNHLLNY